MTATENELFNKVLPSKGCKGLFNLQKCLEKCHCADCNSLVADMLKLNMNSHPYIKLRLPQNDWYMLHLMTS